MNANLELWPLDKIKPYPKNPRVNSDAVEVVAQSLRQFGPRNPILVDPSGVIIAGHTRVKAARKIRLKEFPVIVCHDLDEDQIRAYRIADNKTADKSDWDADLLSEEIKVLDDVGFDFDTMGFTSQEIDKLLGIEEEEKEDKSKGGEKFAIYVDCETEDKQLELLERLQLEGYECKALTS